MYKNLLAFILTLIIFTFAGQNTFAITDPHAFQNNRAGIHIITSSPEEIKEAATLVNSSGGDWGYVTLLIESHNRDHSRWQKVFDDLRRNHLIPLVRLSTEPDGGNWKRPYEGEEEAWADFLNKLNWPTKNRYIIIYNEPNHAQEWGGQTDPKNYAQVLDKTITALKKRSDDFFVLNAGLDASTPHQPPNFYDEINFLKEMNEEVPDIFNKLDGWVSHSYPNPGFIGSPNSSGRGTVRTFLWETQILKSLGLKKDLPVFITETGWKHAEGIQQDSSLPNANTVSNYYKTAYENAWNYPSVVAVTPFLLNYQDPPFDHFSFKKITGEKQNIKLLDVESQHPNYYPQYETYLNLSKTQGKPPQKNEAKLIKGEIFNTLISQETYHISFKVKNTGQTIWNENGEVKLIALEGGSDLGFQDVSIPPGQIIEPEGEYTFNFTIKAPEDGHYKIALNLVNGSQVLDNNPFEYFVTIKTPVMLKVKTALKWKKSSEGQYILKVKGPAGDNETTVNLNQAGISDEIEVRYLLPGYKFSFTLIRPFYDPVTIERPVREGQNTLDFGIMQPNIPSALLNPKQLWRLLPFSG